MKMISKANVNARMERMGYAAVFTVLRTMEDGCKHRFAPGVVCMQNDFESCDEGQETCYDCDMDEVLHVCYDSFVFGNHHEMREAEFDDLNWIEENFEQIQVLLDPLESGRFRVMNPYYDDDAVWEEE